MLSITSGMPACMRDFGDRRDVQHVHARVGDGLGIEQTRARRDRAAEIFRIVRIDERGLNAETPEADIELRVRAAVERAGRHNFVALAEQAGDGDELRRLSARNRQRSHAALRATPCALRTPPSSGS